MNFLSLFLYSFSFLFIIFFSCDESSFWFSYSTFTSAPHSSFSYITLSFSCSIYSIDRSCNVYSISPPTESPSTPITPSIPDLSSSSSFSTFSSGSPIIPTLSPPPVPYGPYSVGPIPDLRPRPLHSAYPIPTPATSHGRIGIMIMFISIRSDWILDLWLEGFIGFCNIEIPSPIHPTKRSIVPEWMPPNGRPRPSTNPRVFILRSWHHSSLSSTRSPTPSPESTTLVRSSSSVNAAFVSINLGFPSPAIRCIIYTSSIASCSLFLWFYLWVSFLFVSDSWLSYWSYLLS